MCPTAYRRGTYAELAAAGVPEVIATHGGLLLPTCLLAECPHCCMLELADMLMLVAALRCFCILALL